MTDAATNDCIFCNIANRTLASEILWENGRVMVIKDIFPKAPVHLLVIPKEHIGSINDLEDEHKELVGELVLTAQAQAQEQGIADSGYKLIFNVGKDGGQIVQHIHLHLLGGKKLTQ